MKQMAIHFNLNGVNIILSAPDTAEASLAIRDARLHLEDLGTITKTEGEHVDEIIRGYMTTKAEIVEQIILNSTTSDKVKLDQILVPRFSDEVISCCEQIIKNKKEYDES